MLHGSLVLAPLPPACAPWAPLSPLRKVIMQLPGRPMWNAQRPLPSRNQSALKCVVTHTPSSTMDLSRRDFSYGAR
ncbi:unnamed protein product [Danaus chrysippus]|uniref:(African queen) hypothetical protein n=1 Tax=Danaus chrysippus TaxID=151541 RepID=A0A8J2QRC5_9NEOP|nr:unnamed protein product [Danaus chrysippus]